MGIGSIVVGIALLAVVAAYLARPFRVARANVGLDRAVEAWVAQVREEGHGGGGGEGLGSEGAEQRHVNFCPQCGQRVSSGDRFCAQCGARLGEGKGE
jgi:hypothetical protein